MVNYSIIKAQSPVKAIGFIIVIFFAVSSVSALSWKDSLNDGIKAFWKMNESSGVLLDSVNRTDVDGKWNASTRQVNYSGNGIIGTGINFSSRNSSIVLFEKGNNSINTSNILWNATNRMFTLSFWVNFSSDRDADETLWYYGDQLSYGGKPEILLRSRDGTTFGIYLSDSGGQKLNNAPFGAISSGWNHVVIQLTNDGSGNLSVWLNGAVNYNNNSISFNGTGVNVTSMFGAIDDVEAITDTGSVLMQIDEVGWWDRFLNASEVSFLYNNGSGLTYGPDTDTPLLNITAPKGNYSNITNIPVTITATDDNLAYCYFNVTRGASLEVSNTHISNCVSTTFVVSGNADYVIHVYVNDTAGNANYSTSNFAITEYIPPPTGGGGASGGGGGGGGTTVIVQGGNDFWNMTTRNNAKLYEINLVRLLDIRRDLVFTNNQAKEISVNLECKGNLCEFIELEKDLLVIPIGTALKTTVTATISLPQDAEAIDYTANIIATDNNGNDDIVTIQGSLGPTGYIRLFFDKLFSIGRFGGVPIPYMALFFFLGTALSYVMFLVFTFEGKGFVASIIGFGISALLVLFV